MKISQHQTTSHLGDAIGGRAQPPGHRLTSHVLPDERFSGVELGPAARRWSSCGHRTFHAVLESSEDRCIVATLAFDDEGFGRFSGVWVSREDLPSLLGEGDAVVVFDGGRRARGWAEHVAARGRAVSAFHAMTTRGDGAGALARAAWDLFVARSARRRSSSHPADALSALREAERLLLTIVAATPASIWVH